MIGLAFPLQDRSLACRGKTAGVVRIAIEHNSTTTLELADELTKRFGLKEAQVAPGPQSGSNAEARRAVGIVARISGADCACKPADHCGAGWGRTLAIWQIILSA